MPVGLLNSLTKDEILDLQMYLENGDFQLPEHLRKQHLPETKQNLLGGCFATTSTRCRPWADDASNRVSPLKDVKMANVDSELNWAVLLDTVRTAQKCGEQWIDRGKLNELLYDLRSRGRISLSQFHALKADSDE